MSDWTEGYFTDVGYTFGYYRELNPLHAKIALQDYNVACPEVRSACELGFGQGLSVNIHAAASTVQWYGTDFMPEQTAFAQKMAAASGVHVQLCNDSFESFAKRKDLPDFDFIGLHGIWSWISNNNRRVIVDFLKKKLKPGGVLYISYNTLPGWADFLSLRHLMTQYMVSTADPRQHRLEQVRECIAFLDRFLATNPGFALVNPNIRNRLKSMHKKDAHYLAHEYFNRDWYPMHFTDIVQWFQSTQLEYICSARYLYHINGFNISSEQEAFLQSITDPVFRESVNDFMINRQFRWDYWVKEPREMNKKERESILQNQQYILTMPVSEVSLQVTEALGKVDLEPEIYKPILELMSDYQPRTLRQIEEELQGKTLKFKQLYQGIVVLLGKGCMEPVQAEESMHQTKAQTEGLNAFLCNQSKASNDIAFLSSPLTGGGIAVSRVEQLFLQNFRQGQRETQQWVEYAWQQLSAGGSKVVKEGHILNSPEENLAELHSLAARFAKERLPMLRVLGIV
ncbi:class I SAM-dependent methyltransferase [Desulfobulbus oralis]|uniref:Methyltransferase n=1 Tax=Desulfobulbus oralis TaxID=1986146 RepID=A0A2L1GQN6_9BACT|nr:class I SAM-dependent methyltransferase [Desulfobulbus oralis]AVD72005.1 methyltransferase [Desulfobulbus oralis]